MTTKDRVTYLEELVKRNSRDVQLSKKRLEEKEASLRKSLEALRQAKEELEQIHLQMRQKHLKTFVLSHNFDNTNPRVIFAKDKYHAFYLAKMEFVSSFGTMTDEEVDEVLRRDYTIHEDEMPLMDD